MSWHRGGGELRGGQAGGGGKLGNQMWSIKTYWHTKGLPLPHSHTESTNSYSSPRCMHVCVCHTLVILHTHTFMHEFTEQYTTCEQPCVHNQSCKMIMPQKQTSKSHVSVHTSYFLIKHVGNGWKTCCSSRLCVRIWINHCWPTN